ncbi:MAG: hypothetical protein AUJ57_05540 [Zetaproteobacteria bacterium CG1_02_53_45]|nr:MAG: hypothetical protein AUJ57_05540 [Zetaproteobacteria bacterium CG1_02_53_45]
MGIFPPGARWYLAAIAIISLLCVAMHLSIQINAQKQAAALIHQWSEEAGIKIGDVRYHLLRNALILQKVSLERERDSLTIDHMLIRANPRLLTGSTPKIGRVEISGFDAVIWNPDSKAAWQHDQRLMSIWHATQSLLAVNGSLTLHLKDEFTPPVKLDALSVQQQIQKTGRRVSATALLAGAPVQWQWLSFDTPNSQSEWTAKGNLIWQDIENSRITDAFGLLQTGGLLSGRADLTISNSGEITVEGEAALSGESGATSSQQLAWQGNLREDRGWQLDVVAKAWPVQPWSENLPLIAGNKFTRGLLDAQLHWQQQKEQWSLSSEQAKLSDVLYADTSQPEQHAWQWEQINLEGLSLNFSRRKLQASRISTENSSMVIGPEQNAAAQRSRKHDNKPGWDISVDKIDIENMTVGLSLPHGELLLPALQGRGSWSKSNTVDFNLRTMQVDADSALAQDRAPFAGWRLAGQAEYKHGDISKSAFKLTGNDIDLARLRPLLPLQGGEGTSLNLAGKSYLHMDVTVTNGEWRARGKASAADVELNRAGETWKAEQIETRFGPVGMGLASQQISEFKADGWQYIGALQPLPAYTTASGLETSDGALPQASWWKNDLRNLNWQIDRLTWTNGMVSIGNSEETWIDRLNITIAPLKSGAWSSISADGRLDHGQVRLNGDWLALADHERFKGQLSVDNSLPFFLHDWMHASGMPRLVRGRLSAQLTVKDGAEQNSYDSHVEMKLARVVADTTVSPNDPMIKRTGYSTPGLIERLSDNDKIISLAFDSQGDWDKQPLNTNRLGISMQKALHQAAVAKSGRKTGSPVTTATQPAPVVGTRIRLRSLGQLSYNERIRLRSVARNISKKPGWLLDLTPKWPGEQVDDETIKRIRYTQQLIERFIAHQKFPAANIYPAWPTARDHSNEVGSIWVILTPPPRTR